MKSQEFIVENADQARKAVAQGVTEGAVGVGWSHKPEAINKIHSWQNSETGTDSRMFQGYKMKFTPDGMFIYKGGDLVHKQPGNFSEPTNKDIMSAKRRITMLINKTQGVTEGSLNEFAVDGFGDSGDNRSKLLATVGRLFDAGNKVDWQVPGQMGHVTRVHDDGITMKKWQMPRSKMSFFLPMRDDSRDSKYTIKMVAPKHYAVVSAEQGVAEDETLDEGPIVQRIVHPSKINIYVRMGNRPPQMIATDIPYQIFDKYVAKVIQKYPQFKPTDFSFKASDRINATQ